MCLDVALSSSANTLDRLLFRTDHICWLNTGLTLNCILLQWDNPWKSRKPCTGVADAAEAPKNWRNPLEHFVKV